MNRRRTRRVLIAAALVAVAAQTVALGWAWLWSEAMDRTYTKRWD